MTRRAAILACCILGLGLIKAPSAVADPYVAPRGTADDRLQLAQLQLNFGISDAVILRSLKRSGYTEIEIYYRGMTKARVRACKNGVRWQLEVKPSGRIKSSSKIGKCRQRINLNRARNILRKKGYLEIVLEENHHTGFEGTACRGHHRVGVVVSFFGDAKETGDLGKCRQLMTRKELAARLRKQGYHRLKFDNRPPPPFILKACKGPRRVKLIITGNGRIRSEKRIGRCGGEIDPARIVNILEGMGYERVRVTDDTLPRYAAEACRANILYEIVLDRYGDVKSKRRTGRCDPALTRKQLRQKLHAEGYRKIRFTKGHKHGFLVEACFGGELFRIEFTLYGETEREEFLGTCQSPRLDQIIKDFVGRGISDAKVFLEGCRKNNRVRIELDSLGQRVGAPKRLGHCH